jgi:phage shock protein C
MPKVKIARNGKVLGEYDEERIPSLLQAGSISLNDHYWSDGMESWETVFSRNWSGARTPIYAKSDLPNWYRSSNSRVIAGVCGGMAHKWGRPAWLVRLVFFLFLPFLLWFLYLILWLALKDFNTSDLPQATSSASNSSGMPVIVKGLVGVMLFGLIASVFFSFIGNRWDKEASYQYARYSVDRLVAIKMTDTSVDFPIYVPDAKEIEISSIRDGRAKFVEISSTVNIKAANGVSQKVKWLAAFVEGPDSGQRELVYARLGNKDIYGTIDDFNAVAQLALDGNLEDTANLANNFNRSRGPR